MNWLNIIGYIVGPGGLLTGGWAILSGRKKGRADAAAQLTTSTLAWAGEMQDRVDALEKAMRARDALAWKHMPWDMHVYSALRNLGQPVEEPPPLIPVEH